MRFDFSWKLTGEGYRSLIRLENSWASYQKVTSIIAPNWVRIGRIVRGLMHSSVQARAPQSSPTFHSRHFANAPSLGCCVINDIGTTPAGHRMTASAKSPYIQNHIVATGGARRCPHDHRTRRLGSTTKDLAHTAGRRMDQYDVSSLDRIDVMQKKTRGHPFQQHVGP